MQKSNNKTNAKAKNAQKASRKSASCSNRSEQNDNY